MLTVPSPYEQRAWQDLQNHRTGRAGTHFMHRAVQNTADLAGRVGERGAAFVDRHEATKRASAVLSKGTRALGNRVKRVTGATPNYMTEAASGAGRAIIRSTQIGLSPARVVRKHQKLGHAIAQLADIGSLDLEQVDAVLGRNRDLAYASFAAAVGGSTSFVITGGEFTIVAGGGVAAAPGVGIIASAFAADTALLLAAASRAVGEISLLYGYDPTNPTEKPFILSAINLGTAVSAASRAAALADVSRVTQLLVRGAPWQKLNEHAVASLTRAFAARFGTRLTKKGLGKALPVIGIAVGASLNWLTIEQIVDAANIAYRHRWLIEKYPDLATKDETLSTAQWNSEEGDGNDTSISVLDLLEEQGLMDDEPDD